MADCPILRKVAGFAVNYRAMDGKGGTDPNRGHSVVAGCATDGDVGRHGSFAVVLLGDGTARIRATLSPGRTGPFMVLGSPVAIGNRAMHECYHLAVGAKRCEPQTRTLLKSAQCAAWCAGLSRCALSGTRQGDQATG